MKGNITTRERCFVCNNNLIHDERRGGCFCPNHPQVGATSFIVRFGKDVYRRFPSYKEACDFLTGLRYKTCEGTYDPNDYKKDNPNGFKTLSEKYLNRKKTKKSFSNIRNYIKVAQSHWEDTNVKYINGADIEDFLFSIDGISEKTRSNYKSTLSDFWKYIYKRKVITIAQMPEFPDIEYELGYRNVTTWEIQSQILDQIKKDATNPKQWFGIELLSVYTKLRPADLLKLTEGDIDLQSGMLFIHYPTKKKNSLLTVRLAPDHVDIFAQLKKQYPALPTVIFFRHIAGIKGVKKDAAFGEKYFYKAWISACDKLGIEGLDLYGGTRHTTTTEIGKMQGKDAAKKHSGHRTNKAFERYCQMDEVESADMAELIIKKKTKTEVLEFKKEGSSKPN
nr:hypothetical protein [uncultured Desulfobacter sp.]